jgi:hypothetical protein
MARAGIERTGTHCTRHINNGTETQKSVTEPKQKQIGKVNETTQLYKQVRCDETDVGVHTRSNNTESRVYNLTQFSETNVSIPEEPETSGVRETVKIAERATQISVAGSTEKNSDEAENSTPNDHNTQEKTGRDLIKSQSLSWIFGGSRQ